MAELYVDTGSGFERIEGVRPPIYPVDCMRRAGQAAEQLGQAFQELDRTVRVTVKITNSMYWFFAAIHWETLVGRIWQFCHPGRRLPGSYRNRRLAKKRAQYLERWARRALL